MRQYCTVAFTDTLMAWDNDLQFHVQSGDHHSTFFFACQMRGRPCPTAISKGRYSPLRSRCTWV